MECPEFSSHDAKEAALVTGLRVALVAEVLELTRDVAPTGIERLELFLNSVMGRLINFTGQVFAKSVDSINFGSVSGTFFAFDLQKNEIRNGQCSDTFIVFLFKNQKRAPRDLMIEGPLAFAFSFPRVKLPFSIARD